MTFSTTSSPGEPARVAPVGQRKHRTCAELGVCQGLSDPCELCNAQRPTPDYDNPDDPDAGATWAVIGGWIGMLAMRLITFATVVGVAGYAYRTFGG